MHTIYLTGKSENEIIDIITKAGLTPERWDEAKKTLGLKKPIADIRSMVPKNMFQKPRGFKHRLEKKDSVQNDRPQNKQFGNNQKTFKIKKWAKTYAEQTDRIDKSELDRRKAAGEYQRCAWPADRKGSHKTIDCFRWKETDKGTAPFPKANEYQKLKVGGYDQDESEIDVYTTDDSEEFDSPMSDSEEEEEEKSDGQMSDSEEDQDEGISKQKYRNWWDSDSE